MASIVEGEKRRVAVIGAGLSGLAAVKCSLDEGLLPVCYEQHDDIGGTWYYTEEMRPNQGAAAFYSLHTNVVKETMAFSDFPMTDDVPLYMSAPRYQSYLHRYARHFDLLRHIRLNHTVISVKPTSDFASSGCWQVTSKAAGETTEKVEIFHSVFICSGYLKKPRMPMLPGHEHFRGEVLHSIAYRKADIFTDKRVLVIGKQSSAADIACDATSTTSQVWLSVGDGTWIIPRTGAGGIPNEYTSKRWFSYLPQTVLGKGMIAIARNTINHQRYSVGDGGNPGTDGTLAVSDDLPIRLVCGRIQVVPRVTGFTETGVLFEDGSTLDVDIVVFATGFAPGYEFVECSDIQSETAVQFNLYKWVFPLNSGGHDTLAMIDAHPVLGSHVPSIEMSCRWASRVFSGRCKLPPGKKMQAYIQVMAKYYAEKCNNKFKGTWVGHSDELAEEIGVHPSFLSLLLRSPGTAWRVFLGPAFPCHYRLLGPGSCDLAWQETHRLYDMLHPTDISTSRRLVKLTMLVAIPLFLALRYHHYAPVWSFLNQFNSLRWLKAWGK